MPLLLSNVILLTHKHTISKVSVQILSFKTLVASKRK